MASLGSFTVNCPVCHRDYTVGTTSSGNGPTRTDAGTLVLTFELSRADMEAHYLTHGTHDGEPLPQAA